MSSYFITNAYIIKEEVLAEPTQIIVWGRNNLGENVKQFWSKYFNWEHMFDHNTQKVESKNMINKSNL